MTLFQTRLPKMSGPVRHAFKTLIGRIQRSIECTEVYNILPTPFTRGMIMSLADHPITHQEKLVIPTSDANILCKQQFVGILESALEATSDPTVPGVSIARHSGGPVYVAMDSGISDLHVGDSIWATTDLPGGYGQIMANVGQNPIYIGMVSDLHNYNQAAAAGSTGVMCIVKHGAPTPILN